MSSISKTSCNFFVFVACALITGCATTPKGSARLHAFYKEARKRQMHHRIDEIDLGGLNFMLGDYEKTQRFPPESEDSILVSDPTSPESGVVQVIVDPRVSGSFLDPQEPSPEFLIELRTDTENALRTHRYRYVSWFRGAIR